MPIIRVNPPIKILKDTFWLHKDVCATALHYRNVLLGFFKSLPQSLSLTDIICLQTLNLSEKFSISIIFFL